MDQEVEELKIAHKKIVHAQKVNQHYQALLTEALRLVDAQRESLQKEILALQSTKKERVKPKDSEKSRLSYFQCEDEVPPVKDGTRATRHLHTFENAHWSEKQDEALVNAIKGQAHSAMIAQLVNKYSKVSALDRAEYEREVEAMKGLTLAHVEERLSDRDNFILEDANAAMETEGKIELQWGAIQEAYNDLKGKSWMDCKRRWALWLKPSINKGPWSAAESKYTVALRDTGRDWPSICEELAGLGKQRTPVQCLMEYREKTKSKFKNRKWTPEEDQKLIAVVGQGSRNWERIAYNMDSRTTQQCIYRWKQTLDPSIVRGRKWSKEEDLILTCAVKIYHDKDEAKHPHWTKIKKHLPGRTDTMCRERWTNCLWHVLNKSTWSKEEMMKLVDSVYLHGKGKWAKICKDLFPRTDNQCRRQWDHIMSFVDDVSEEESSDGDYDDERAARMEREQRKNRFVSKLNRVYVDIPGLGEMDVNNSSVFAFPLVTASENIKHSLVKIVTDFGGDMTIDEAALAPEIDFTSDAFRMLASWVASVYLPTLNDLVHPLPKIEPEEPVKKGKKTPKKKGTPAKATSAPVPAKVTPKSTAKSRARTKSVSDAVEILPIVDAVPLASPIPTSPAQRHPAKKAANNNAPIPAIATASVVPDSSETPPTKKRRASTPRKRATDDEFTGEENGKPKKKRKQKKATSSDDDVVAEIMDDLGASEILPRTRSMRNTDPSKRRSYVDENDEIDEIDGGYFMDLLQQSKRKTSNNNIGANNNSNNSATSSNNSNSRNTKNSSVAVPSILNDLLPQIRKPAANEAEPKNSSDDGTALSGSGFFTSFISKIAEEKQATSADPLARNVQIPDKEDAKSDSFDSDDFDDDAASKLLFANISGKK